MSYGPWAIANSRPVRAIRGNALRTLPLLKRFPHPSGANPQGPARRHAHRALVARRSPGRSADQAHPPLGKTRNPAFGAKGSAPRLSLDFRCHLPRRGQGCWHRHASLQQRGDEHAPRRDRLPCRAGRPCRPAARSGRVAWVGRTDRARQHHDHAAAAQMP